MIDNIDPFSISIGEDMVGIYMSKSVNHYRVRSFVKADMWMAHTAVSGGFQCRLIAKSRSYDAESILYRVAKSFTKSELESVSRADVSIRTGKTLNIILEGGVSDDNSC